MAKRQTLSINTITAGDIKRRHPRYLHCETDRAYAQLANDIHKLLHKGFTFMEERQFRNACISMALFFEDMRSGLHLFETFTQMYQKMYGCYLPFYTSANADAPEAPLDAMRFMLWHSCVAERKGAVINPTNDGVKAYAEMLLDLWEERKQTLPPNEELADFLYAEETQTDANMVKTVLVWLSRYCPLGRWFTSLSDEELTDEYKDILNGIDKDTMVYAADCYSLFERQTWPLSMTPQHVYAEMIRLDMNDPDDPLAEAIDHLVGRPFGIYEVMGLVGNAVRLKDFLGRVISVDQHDFLGDVKQIVRKNTHLGGSVICLDGKWCINGPCIWSKPVKRDIDKQLDKLRYQHHLLNDYAGQYDNFISSHGGERLYICRNAKEHRQWLKNELKLNAGEMPITDEYKSKPIAVFFEDNGQMSNCFETACIKHPDNPGYNIPDAEESSMTFFVSDFCSPGMLLYLIRNGLLPDIMFNDMHGREHGRRLLQDNIDFMARCMRRDITDGTVVRPRTFHAEETDDSEVKQTFDSLVRLIAAEKTIYSKACKKWCVVRADAKTTVIRDVRRQQDHSITTRALYEAHLALDADKIQVAAMVPFVGREDASAASALLYCIVGNGKRLNSLRKLTDLARELDGFEELRKLTGNLVKE
mgnify:CR=1 FL=1